MPLSQQAVVHRLKQYREGRHKKLAQQYARQRGNDDARAWELAYGAYVKAYQKIKALQAATLKAIADHAALPKDTLPGAKTEAAELIGTCRETEAKGHDDFRDACRKYNAATRSLPKIKK